MEHIVIYRDERYFAAWPFNGGFWQFADGELAVGFVRGICDYGERETIGHATVDCGHGEHVILRSADGGRTWPVSRMTTVYRRPALDERLKSPPAGAAAVPERYDPRADGYCLLSVFGIPPRDAPHLAAAFVSSDRGVTWSEPVILPAGGFPVVGGRPGHVVRDDGAVLLFGHGRRTESAASDYVPLVWASDDGGARWGLLAEIEPTPRLPKAIMPYPLTLGDGTILAAIRREYDFRNAFTQTYRSTDGGRTWSFLSRVNDWGAPAALGLLPDGRVVCAYGYRREPAGIRARISGDGGATWGGEIVLRDDGGSPDLGYPRLAVRPDGSLIVVYYFNRKDDSIQCNGGVRHIAATLWTP